MVQLSRGLLHLLPLCMGNRNLRTPTRLGALGPATLRMSACAASVGQWCNNRQRAQRHAGDAANCS